MQVYLGSLYVNDFNRFGRTYQVNVQAESPYRLQPEDISHLRTRNLAGEMIPLGSVVTVKPIYGPDRVMHYNGFPARKLTARLHRDTARANRRVRSPRCSTINCQTE